MFLLHVEGLECGGFCIEGVCDIRNGSFVQLGLVRVSLCIHLGLFFTSLFVGEVHALAQCQLVLTNSATKRGQLFH